MKKTFNAGGGGFNINAKSHTIFQRVLFPSLFRSRRSMKTHFAESIYSNLK